MKKALLILFLSVFTFASAHAYLSKNTLGKVDVFKSGEGGYDTYRIPVIIRTPEGDLLAICEGRRDNASDRGAINLLVKRSSDNGHTWGPAQVIWQDGEHTCGNPCAVVDQKTNEIILLSTHNHGEDTEVDLISKRGKSTRTVWVIRSSDDGRTWSNPEEITKNVKDSAWGWYATGPGVGIQIQDGPHAGRLVIPCVHSYDDPNGKVRGGHYEYGSHAIHSDDHGKTWKLGGTIRPKVNECQVVELFDGKGTLLMNMRSYFERNRRTHAISHDGGLTWSSPRDVPELIEPVCQASIIRFGKNQLLFSNPAAIGRVNMTIKASPDNGKTWSNGLPIHRTVSGYSSLIDMGNGQAGCLYECGDEIIYHERITFAWFNLK